jgi:hypothetical protein
MLNSSAGSRRRSAAHLIHDLEVDHLVAVARERLGAVLNGGRIRSFPRPEVDVACRLLLHRAPSLRDLRRLAKRRLSTYLEGADAEHDSVLAALRHGHDTVLVGPHVLHHEGRERHGLVHRQLGRVQQPERPVTAGQGGLSLIDSDDFTRGA